MTEGVGAVFQRRRGGRWYRTAVGSAAMALVSAACAAPRETRVPSGPAAAHNSVALVNVAVVSTQGAGSILPRQTVVVEGERISAVGDAGTVHVPAGARMVDGRGMYVIAGLADMHVHLEYTTDPSFLRAFLARGVTTVRSMDGRPYISAWRDAIARGSLSGPRITTAGPIIDGDPPVRGDNLRVRDSTAARVAVRAQHAARYDFIKVYSNLSPAAYTAVLDEARRLGMPVAGHLPRRVSLAMAIAAGQRVIEHLTDYTSELETTDSPFRGRFHWSKLYLGIPVDSVKLERLGALLAEHRVWTVPTLVERDRALAPADSVARWVAGPEMALIGADGIRLWRTQLTAAAARMDSADWELARQGQQNRRRVVGALYRTGAPLLIGTDTPNAFVVPGISLHEELERFVESGLSRAATLDIATRGAAQFLGENAAGGTIAAGARADLLLVRGNPLEDLRVLRAPVRVMAGGRWFDHTK